MAVTLGEGSVVAGQQEPLQPLAMAWMALVQTARAVAMQESGWLARTGGEPGWAIAPPGHQVQLLAQRLAMAMAMLLKIPLAEQVLAFEEMLREEMP